MEGWPDRLPDGSEVWYDPGTGTSTPLDPNRTGAQPVLAQPKVAAAPTFDWSGLWGGLTNSNQQQFDWTKNSFGMTLDEQKRQADMQNAIQQQQLGLQNTAQKSSLAQSLLSGAASLRGPADWLSYANYTNGGKGIFDMLYGSQTAPAFGEPGGNSTVMTIQKLLADLGLNNIGGGGGTATGAAGSYQTPNGVRTLDQMRQELFQASGGMPEKLSADEATTVADYARTVGGQVTAAQQTAPTTQTAQMQTAMDQATAPITGDAPVSAQPYPMVGGDYSNDIGQVAQPYADPRLGQPQPAANNQAPLPYQINPAVWDSLSPTAKTMILASAQMGNTPSGAWSADDYLQQLEASRPGGTAPRAVSYGYGGSQGYY